MDKLFIIIVVLLFLFCDNPVDAPQTILKDGSLIGTWQSDTIKYSQINDTLKIKTNFDEFIKVRITQNIAELNYSYIYTTINTRNDSIRHVDTCNPWSILTIDEWETIGDTIAFKTLSNYFPSRTVTVKSTIVKYKYKIITNNEVWFMYPSKNYDSLNDVMWTWYKCKKVL
jgi:hypothetical protein